MLIRVARDNREDFIRIQRDTGDYAQRSMNTLTPVEPNIGLPGVLELFVSINPANLLQSLNVDILASWLRASTPTTEELWVFGAFTFSNKCIATSKDATSNRCIAISNKILCFLFFSFSCASPTTRCAIPHCQAFEAYPHDADLWLGFRTDGRIEVHDKT